MSNRTLAHLLNPFAAALADPSTTEVVVNRPGEFGVEANGVWTFHSDPSLTFDRLDALGVLAAYRTSQDLSPTTPMVGTTLPGGERLQVCRPPATLPGIISLTIRRPSSRTMRVDDSDFDGLLDQANTGLTKKSRADAELLRLYEQKDWRAFFKLAVQSKKTIGATGLVGSGKTSFLRRLMPEIPAHERMITIEDTSEFGDVGPDNRVALFYGDGRANLTAEQVLKATLRMRPDRLFMQEVRGPEAFGFIRALATGHAGATSWHAEEGREFDALALMVKQHDAGRAIPDDALKTFLRSYIDITVWCSRDDDGFHTPRIWFRGADQ